MADKDLRKMNRSELIEIIYAQQQNEEASGEASDEVKAERERLQYQRRFRRTLRSTVYALVVVAAVAILISTMFLPVLKVSGTSMEPTLSDDDIIVLAKTGDFETGDVVGFYYQNKLLLKRVIGAPGDVIDIDDEGNVIVNGELLDEPYLTEKALGETDLDYPYQVPESRYFVMGDNRAVSVDSRSSAIGCIEADQIVGKVVFRVWPLKRLSWIHTSG
ncbi:MAG: signal peptidase I [Clostridiales bacterium]|nr:signal peptidase I [Clostridiales bacterium]